ncbi:hypothetical protein QBC47DRAFT_358259 [Echria macrotheca]|uniref:Pre-mRNA-splicing factor 38B n=1 Tax=Echria macrotheca TaxID=438768 RepID=A0AAJ0BJL3_9PEZI|nr:hypothetical protein QBC47DRAFT_358259 [Echria macrotheca]
MSNDTILTDDYVADLLAKEASDASIKYSSMGLEAFRSAKPANKAKPNVRFLGRIIKETTSHNAALLAKESAEAQARLDDLTEAEARKRRKLNPSADDIRKRQLGDISSILLGGKRKRGDDGGGERSANKTGERQPEDRRSGRDDETRSKRVSGRDDRDRRSRQDGKDRNRSMSPASRPRRHRDRSPLDDDNRNGYDASRRDGRRSKRSTRDLIEGDIQRRKRHGRLLSDDVLDVGEPNSRKSSPSPDDFGPEPAPRSPVRRRGRGAGKGASAMDSRFSSDYDPQSDVQPDADERDWEEAAEAYRDRQKWRQQGAEKLRAAGFTEEQVKKWEKGDQKDVDDVRWSKAGEGREWDRGKEGIET